MLHAQQRRDRTRREAACQRTRRIRQLGENDSRGALRAVSGKGVDTVGSAAVITVGANNGEATASTELRIAPAEQHEAHALHLCLLASLTLSNAAEVDETLST